MYFCEKSYKLCIFLYFLGKNLQTKPTTSKSLNAQHKTTKHNKLTTHPILTPQNKFKVLVTIPQTKLHSIALGIINNIIKTSGFIIFNFIFAHFFIFIKFKIVVMLIHNKKPKINASTPKHQLKQTTHNIKTNPPIILCAN